MGPFFNPNSVLRFVLLSLVESSFPVLLHPAMCFVDDSTCSGCPGFRLPRLLCETGKPEGAAPHMPKYKTTKYNTTNIQNNQHGVSFSDRVHNQLGQHVCRQHTPPDRIVRGSCPAQCRMHNHRCRCKSRLPPPLSQLAFRVCVRILAQGCVRMASAPRGHSVWKHLVLCNVFDLWFKPLCGASSHALGLHLAGCCVCVASLSRVVSAAMVHFGTCVWPAHHCRLSGRLHARVWAMAPDLHSSRGDDLANLTGGKGTLAAFPVLRVPVSWLLFDFGRASS